MKSAPFFVRFIPSRSVSGIFLCYSLSVLAAALPAGLFFFYVRDVLQAEAQIPLFLSLYIIPGLLTLPLWRMMARRQGAGSAWLIAMAFTLFSFMGVCFLNAGDIIPYAIICVLTGLTFGAEFFLPVIVLKKAIAAEKDEARAVQHYATLALLGKMVAFIGCLPLIPFLALPDNAAAMRGLLIFLYGIVPCLIKASATYVLWRWIKHDGENNEKPLANGNIHAA